MGVPPMCMAGTAMPRECISLSSYPVILDVSRDHFIPAISMVFLCFHKTCPREKNVLERPAHRQGLLLKPACTARFVYAKKEKRYGE